MSTRQSGNLVQDRRLKMISSLKRTFRPTGAFIGLSLFLGMLTGPAHAQQLTPVKLRLDWVWQAPQSIFTIAYERGYYRDEGLDLSIDRGYGGLENSAALGSGQYDFLFGDMTSVMLFNDKNAIKEISVLQIQDAYLGAVIVRAGGGIEKPKDLEGKVIGAPLNTGGRVMFPTFAEKNGIDESKITWTTIGIQLQDQQFAQGQFDAIAGFSTTSLLNLQALGLTRDKLKIFAFSDYGVDLYGSGIVVRREYVDSHPDIIRKFVKATIRGVQAMVQNKQEAIETIRKRDPLLDDRTELDRLNLSIEMTLDRPSVRDNGIGFVDPARIESSIKTISKVFKLASMPVASDIYTVQFIPPKEERLLKLQ
jgi:NitT/TauT family transport system substrate-binding protein